MISLYRPFLILTFFSALATYLVCSDGFPIGYDYKNQIIAYEAVSSQIRGGELYPRWLADINQGFGGTNLFFYPPFSYYITFLIDAVTKFSLHTPLLLVLNVFVFICASSLSFYILARSIAPVRYALPSALLYLFLPYHLWFEVYERNALAELSSYTWIPLIFLFLDPRIIKHKRALFFLSVCYCMLILSHLPTAVFSSLFFGAYAVLQMAFLDDHRRRITYGLRCFVCILLGAGLAGFYLYPALSLLDHTRSDYLWSGYYAYQNWFLWFNPQCPSKTECRALFSIALTQMLVPLCGACFLWVYRGQSISFLSDNIVQSYLILSLLCFFLVTPLSHFIWTLISPLQNIQFPWRMLVLSDFFFALIFLLLLRFSDKRTRPYIVGLFVISFTSLSFYISSYVRHTETPPISAFQDSIEKQMLTQEHIPNNPNFIKSFKELQQEEEQALWSVRDGQADVMLIHKTPRMIEFSVHAQNVFTLDVRQFMFIGWRVFKGGADISASVNLRDTAPYGQIRLDLPRGDYHFSLVLGTLQEERMGLMISVISAFLLCLIMAIGVYVAKKEP